MARHVMFDADGVLQEIPGGWFAAARPYLGERTEPFLHAAWAAERPLLTETSGDYLAILGELLTEFGATHPTAEIYAAIWNNVETNAGTVETIHRLRSAGNGVHLGTNQARHRSSFMRTVLGYDDLFDTCCYSYDLGLAKPDPEFFREASRRIGVAPEEVVFVDDSAANVEAALSTGMLAVHWSFLSGAEHTGNAALITQLAERGVLVDAHGR